MHRTAKEVPLDAVMHDVGVKELVEYGINIFSTSRSAPLISKRAECSQVRQDALYPDVCGVIYEPPDEGHPET